jgi:hypothetical protein
MLLGSVRRPVQSVKFIRRSFFRDPMVWETAVKLGQSLRTSFSRLGKLEKSGVLVKSREWLRLRIFSFSSICKKIKAQENNIVREA